MTETATEVDQMAFERAQAIYEVIGSKLLALGVNVTESQVEAVTYAVWAHLEKACAVSDMTKNRKSKA